MAAEQQTAGAAIAQRGGRVLTATNMVMNSLVVEHGDAAELAAIPGVMRVYPVYRVKATLNRVIHLHKVIDAWQAAGGVEKAGLGVKIGILDTGVDASHPWLSDEEMPPLEGYPKVSKEANLVYTSRKVIVARSYEELNGEEYGRDAADRNSHGTSAAAAAAAVPVEFRGLVLSGVAPMAYLGNYKVLGDDGGGSSDAILRAIDDAVRDGMDVLNLSLGSDLAVDPSMDAQYKAVEAACLAGVIVVAAAGNAGPDENTINSPSTAPCAISVGSSSNDRTFENFPGSVPLDPNQVSSFSSRGPNVGPALKPDMLAVGDNFLTAESTLKPGAIGFTVTQGTSFATPVVAGAAAVLKGALKGRTVAQLRSHLINSTTLLLTAGGASAPVRFAGAGVLNLDAALKSTAAATPTSISFGAGPGTLDIPVRLSVANLTSAPVAYSISVESPPAAAATVSTNSLLVSAQGSGELVVRLSKEGLPPGEYQGRVRIRSGSDGRELSVPYWYAVTSAAPAKITLLEAKTEGAAGDEVVFGIRVLDGAGVALAVKPAVEAGPGGGSVMAIEPAGAQFPGVFLVQVKLGAGENLFRIVAGEVRRELSITGK
jgi:hypothetical protein